MHAHCPLVSPTDKNVENDMSLSHNSMWGNKRRKPHYLGAYESNSSTLKLLRKKTFVAAFLTLKIQAQVTHLNTTTFELGDIQLT